MENIDRALTYNNYEGPERRTGAERRHCVDRRGYRDYETGQLSLPFFTIGQPTLPFLSSPK